MQGLERDRFAILTKTHHAMVDGISGVDIGTVLFDLEPVPEPAAVEDDWVPQKSPSTAELVGRGLGDVAGLPIKAAEKAVEAIRHPESAARKAVEALEALSAVVSQFADPAPDVPLNVEIGPHRRYVWARSELATFKRIKDSLGGTVNDVVLAAVDRLDPQLAAQPRRAHRGAGAAGAGAGLDPRRGRARQPRQPDHADARPAAGLHRGPGAPPPHDQRGDGGAEGIQTGAGGGNDLPLQRLRAADAARAGLAPQLLHPPLQPAGHQRARAADPPLRPGTGTGRGLPGRLPAAEPRARDRDHELPRQDRLRPARRLRLDGGHRPPRRRDQRSARRAAQPPPASPPRRRSRAAGRGGRARLPSVDGPTARPRSSSSSRSPSCT